MDDTIDLSSEPSTSAAATSGSSKGAGGRPPSKVWDYFDKGGKKNNRNIGVCMYCKNEFDGKPETLEKHILRICTKVPREVKDELLAALSEKVGSTAAVPTISRAATRRAVDGGQTQLDRYFDTKVIPPDVLHEMNARQFRFFAMCNISFKAADSRWFLDWMEIVRPNYHPAGKHNPAKHLKHTMHAFLRKLCTHLCCALTLYVCTTGATQLRTKYLGEELVRVDADFKLRVVHESNLTAQMDGWTDVGKKSVYAVTVSVRTEAAICWQHWT